MKTTVIILVVLGLVAAFCVVLLINAIPYLTGQVSKNPEISVITTTRQVEPMTILTEDMVSMEPVLLNEAPQGYFTSTAQVVGRVVAVRLVQGQPITSDKIVRGGSSAELAATIPAGMRAVSVSLSSQQISGGLLYPGCIVDVLVAYNLGRGSKEAKGEALSTTMFEKVQVLAVEGESVISQKELEKDAKGKTSGSSSRGSLTVTLLVDTDQAEALQLAVMNGQISLAMRNPNDAVPVDPDATILNRGRLGRLGRLVGTTVEPKRPGEILENPDSEESRSSTVNYAPIQDSSPWEMTVIRGQEVTIEEFKEPK